MHFSFKDYLKQLFLDSGQPPILNPNQYWQTCCIEHLNLCWKNNWIEHCYHLDYSDYTTRYLGVVARHHLEEDDATFLEHCWIDKSLSYRSYCDSVERFLETHIRQT
ncbi:hypothetical protein [cf. Phormidesmis sp. LEGE 11477]|uniref:hypothetical protein n=1 Tax=cf. Phormidesmis sp. LEGE 11477 TaxID=1828680 RepID=UPI00187FBFC5|nr:hypothetical protein [cf. Phormidesmis sp. LEGE 11477]MBE9063160.1 hypothetical protein [cf. Phormidesmis sp. LEGE 11477]